MSVVPRPPLIPDPLGRIRVPRDLDSITTIADEVDPERVGLSTHKIERIWSAARGLFRTALHPALQLWVRRHGEVVIDRAIGHARGNGRDDNGDSPKVLATTETPFCVFSTSKGITAMVIHLLHERRALSI